MLMPIQHLHCFKCGNENPIAKDVEELKHKEKIICPSCGDVLIRLRHPPFVNVVDEPLCFMSLEAILKEKPSMRDEILRGI